MNRYDRHTEMIWRISLCLLAFGMIASIFTGCSGPDHGRVADEKYHPAYTTWHAGSTSCSGTPTRCTSTPGWMEFVPQSWELRLIDGGDDGWRDVDETTFHRCHVGDHYPECASS